MSLEAHLHLGTPLIWVHSDESGRVVDEVALNSRRDVYRMDTFDGLLRYVDGGWRRVMIKYPDDTEGPTYDFHVAFEQVYERKGTFIIPNAHIAAKELISILTALYDRYRSTFLRNDVDQLPCQIVMISCTDKIPPEIIRQVAVVDYDLPDEATLAERLIDISSGINKPVFISAHDEAKLPRAGLGLSEAEFMQAVLTGLRAEGVITSAYVNQFKRDKIKSEGILEVRNPSFTLDHIGGMDNAKDLVRAVVWGWENPEKNDEYMLKALRRILLLGLPGTGKSLLCEAVASTLELDLVKFGTSQTMSKWVGESERQMRDAFKQIAAMAPVVAWVDELGRDMSGSGSTNDSGTTDRVHGLFLTGMQELPDNVIFVGAANRVSGLPPEMLRAGRFDKILFSGFPTALERKDIWKIHLGARQEFHDTERLAEASVFYTGAEIESLVIEVRNRISRPQDRHITDDDLVEGMGRMKNRLWIKHKDEVLASYEQAVVECEWASSEQLEEADFVLSKGQQKAPLAGNKKMVSF